MYEGVPMIVPACVSVSSGTLLQLRTDPARRSSSGVRLAQDLGDAPVEQHRLAEGAEHHVLGLQVAVEHAPAVGVGDRLAERDEHLEQSDLLHLAGAGVGLRSWNSSMTFWRVRPWTNFIT